MAQATLKDYIASLDPEAQTAFLAELDARVKFEQRKSDVGAPLAHLQNFGVGLGRGLVNAAVGLGQLPLAISNAVFNSDFETRPVFGAGSITGQDSFDIGGGAGLGGFGGFLASFAIPGGIAAKSARLLTAGKTVSAGQRIAGRVGTALAPDLALTRMIPRGNLPLRIGGAAAEFGALSFARTPGDLSTRTSSGLHALPAGALLGAAGRPLALITREGQKLTGRAMTKWVERRGGMENVLRTEQAAYEPIHRFAFSQVARLGGAGFLLPGFSPVEFTGNPRIDSAIFNAGFGLSHAISARAPKIPGREAAQVIEIKDREGPADTTPAPAPERVTKPVEPREPVQLSLFPERAPTEAFDSLVTKAHVPDIVTPLQRSPVLDPTQRPGLYVDTPFGPSIAYPIGSRVSARDGSARGEVTGFEGDKFTVKHTDGTTLVYEQAELAVDRTRSTPDTSLDFAESPIEGDFGNPLAVIDARINVLTREFFTLNDAIDNANPTPNGALLAKQNNARYVELNNEIATLRDDRIRVKLNQDIDQGKGFRKEPVDTARVAIDLVADVNGNLRSDADTLPEEILTRASKGVGEGFAPDIIARSATDPINAELVRTSRNPEDLLAKEESLGFLSDIVRDDLSELNRSMFDPNTPLRIRLMRGLDQGYRAAFSSDLNTLLVSARYFQQPRFARQTTLAHELTHGRLNLAALERIPSDALITLFNRAGWPARRVPSRGTDALNLEQILNAATARNTMQLEMAQEALTFHFGERAPTLDGLYEIQMDPSNALRGRMRKRIEKTPNALDEVAPIPDDVAVALLDSSNKGGSILVGQHTDSNGQRFFTPFVIHRGAALSTSITSNLNRITFLNIHRSFLKALDTADVATSSQPLGGSRYGYTNPLEYVTEGVVHQLLNSPESMRSTHPGMNTLLRALFRNRMSATVQGRRNLLETLERDPAQRELFSPSEFQGPIGDVQTGFFDSARIVPIDGMRKLERTLDFARHEDETAPQRKFLAGTSESSLMYLDQTSRRNKLWDYLTKPFVGSGVKALRGAFRDNETIDATFDTAYDRFMNLDFPPDTPTKVLEREFVNILRDEASAKFGKAPATFTDADGHAKPLDDLPVKIEDGSTLTAATIRGIQQAGQRIQEGKGRLVDGQLLFEHSTLAKRILDEKLARVFSGGTETLERAIPDATTREIIRLRYGAVRDGDRYVYTEPDGSPMSSDGEMSRAMIAVKVKRSVSVVSRRIANFIQHQTVDIPTSAQGQLALRLPRRPQKYNRYGDPLDITDVTPEPKTTTRLSKTPFQFRDPKDPTKRIKGVPQERETLVDGDVVTRETFVKRSELPGGVKGVDKIVIPGDVEYIDPVTGEVYTRQTSLFDVKEKLAKRVKAEREEGIEKAIDATIEPPQPTREEHVAQEISRQEIDQPVVDSTPKEPVQLRFKGAGFGRSRKPIDTRFKSNNAVANYAVRYGEAAAKVGERGMNAEEFNILRLNQQVEHVIKRLARAPNAKVYTRTLLKYAKLLNTAGKFPTFTAVARKFKKSDRVSIVMNRVDALHMEIQFNPDRTIRLTELDTNRSYDVKDIGTAALVLDMRTERLKTAPELGPPEFEHIKLRFSDTDGAGGGPRDPIGPDRASDGESNGLPPQPTTPEAAARYRESWVFSTRVRSMRDIYATISEKIGDPDLLAAVDALINSSTRADIKAQQSIRRMEKLAKGHGVKPARMLDVGRAAAEVDDLGFARVEATKNIEEGRAFVKGIEDKIYAAHELEPGEVAFLKDARKEWDRLFRILGLSDVGYIPGYFSRFRPRDANDTSSGTLRTAGMPSTAANFFALHERSGELAGRDFHFMEVWSAYARAGWRYKLISGPAGEGRLTPLEFADKVIRKYSESKGNRTVYPQWAEPFVQLMDRAQGAPDPGMVAARDAARGRLKGLQSLVGKTAKWVENNNIPARNVIVPMLKRHYESLGVSISDANLTVWADYVIALSRSRAFGLNVMRSIRHITQSSFFTLPRVGVKYFGLALNDVLNPAKFERIFLRATAAGAIKPAYAHEYINSRSKLLSNIDKLSFIYRYGDIWERTLSFHAQELKNLDAMEGFRGRAASTGFEANYEQYARESGLTLLHPAFRRLVKDLLDRPDPQYVRAVREHARLLTDHTLFDYSRVNQPMWAGSVWGRLFGQYGRWTLGAIETMNAMTRYGSYAQRAEVAALYSLVAAGVYGMGQALGVKTADWIPFVHTLGYGGGPSLSIVEDIKRIVGGDPISQDTFVANWTKDPAATFLSTPFRMFVPAGDIIEALAADTNMTRRQRRLFGIPRRALNEHEQLVRLFGFRPITDAPTRHSLLKETFGKPFKGIKEEIQRAVGSKPAR